MARRSKKKNLPPPKWDFRRGFIYWYRARSPVFQFSSKLAILMALFYALFATPYFDGFLYTYLRLNASLSNSILVALGLHTTLTDVTIRSAAFAVTIQRGCDAVEPTWLFCSAVLSFPSPWPHRVFGMIMGIILLQALNLIRIISLFWIGIHWPSIFNQIHMEIWPTAFVLVSIVLFVSWRDWTSRNPILHAVP